MFSFLKSGVNKIKKALAKTRLIFSDKLKALFGKPLSEDTLEELERILFEADLGSECAVLFTDKIKRFAKGSPNAKAEDLLGQMKLYAKELLSTSSPNIPSFSCKPYVILVVGVNGSGKTTTCAKLAKHFLSQGKTVLLAAGDTFRAAAIDQLEVWAKRLKIDLVKGLPGGDPSSVIFDAISSATAKGIDIVIADTAGRLQAKTDLMQELAKVRRSCDKALSSAPHETLLVLDATTGQNALDQAKVFHSFTPLTGLILTKLDGSAKGGIVLAISHLMKLPIPFIGVGEGEDDLMPFDAESYLDALFSS